MMLLNLFMKISDVPEKGKPYAYQLQYVPYFDGSGTYIRDCGYDYDVPGTYQIKHII